MTLSTISLLSPDPNIIWEDKGAKSVSFFCKRYPIRIDAALISELKTISTERGNKNVRVCLHHGPDALHHDMVILERRGKYYRPHKHLEKGEAFHVIEGRFGIFTFDEGGAIQEACILQSGDILRVGPDMYHAVMPLTDIVIYHENKPGPFLGSKDSIYPDWAPDGGNEAETDAYCEALSRHLS